MLVNSAGEIEGENTEGEDPCAIFSMKFGFLCLYDEYLSLFISLINFI